MQKPLISIIIPTYNRAHLLPRAIKSVTNQTYSNFELIIVNDGSTDNTPEVVKSFKDPRIIYLTYEKGPKGPNFARNTGLNVAKGELITFMGDDDELTSDALKSIADTFIRVLVLRTSTERPEAIEAGFAKVIGTSRDTIIDEITKILDNPPRLHNRSPFGDGKAAKYITEIIINRKLGV
jgi:glycosyltransferase involved in cell wall biosynthesis